MRALVLACAVAASACFLPRRHPELPPPRQSPARDSLLAVDRARADSLARRGLEGAMRTFLDSSVIYLRAGAFTAYGSDRALQLLRAARPAAGVFTTWQPLGGGLSRDGLSGYTFGLAVRAVPEPPASLVERYVAFWSRSHGGPWRITGYIEVSSGDLSTTPGEKPSPVTNPTPAVSALLRVDSGFAERASSLDAASAMGDAISADGVLLVTTQLIVGPDAAVDYFESLRSFSISWAPRDGRVASSGDLGFTVGDALTTSLSPTGAAMQSFTKYLTVWRREADGRWRVVVMGANERPNPIVDAHQSM